MTSVGIRLQYGNEGRLRNFNVADHFHALFALLLLLEQFALSADVAAVALGGDVFAEGIDGRPRDDRSTDGALDGDLELLAGDRTLQLLASVQHALPCLVAMDELGEGVHGLAVERG